jgi:hypothetical protein
LFGCAFGDDLPAVGAGLGAEVDDPVGFLGMGRIAMSQKNEK